VKEFDSVKSYFRVMSTYNFVFAAISIIPAIIFDRPSWSLRSILIFACIFMLFAISILGVTTYKILKNPLQRFKNKTRRNILKRYRWPIWSILLFPGFIMIVAMVYVNSADTVDYYQLLFTSYAAVFFSQGMFIFLYATYWMKPKVGLDVF